MVYPNTISGYQILGTVQDKTPVRTYLATIRNAENVSVLLNEVQYQKDTALLMKEALQVQCVENANGLLALFSETGCFYLVFPFYKETSFRMRFIGNPDEVSIGRRLEVFRNILYTIYAFRRLPSAVLLSAVSPDAICVREDSSITINFILDIETLAHQDQGSLFPRIAGLLRLLMEQELRNENNRALRIIQDKCEKCLYDSIPACIKDMEGLEERCAAPGWGDCLGEFTKRHERLFGRLRTYGSIGIAVVVVLYLCVSMIGKPLTQKTGTPVYAIGGVPYAAIEGAGNVIPPSTAETQTVFSQTEMVPVLAEDAGYEDHIVQFKETLSEVCQTYYGDTAFETVVAQFNKLDPDTALEAGTILKLPHREDILLT